MFAAPTATTVPAAARRVFDTRPCAGRCERSLFSTSLWLTRMSSYRMSRGPRHGRGPSYWREAYGGAVTGILRIHASPNTLGVGHLSPTGPPDRRFALGNSTPVRPHTGIVPPKGRDDPMDHLAVAVRQTEASARRQTEGTHHRGEVRRTGRTGRGPRATRTIRTTRTLLSARPPARRSSAGSCARKWTSRNAG